MRMLEAVTSWVATLGLFQRTLARVVIVKGVEEKDQGKKEGQQKNSLEYEEQRTHSSRL